MLQYTCEKRMPFAVLCSSLQGSGKAVLRLLPPLKPPLMEAREVWSTPLHLLTSDKCRYISRLFFIPFHHQFLAWKTTSDCSGWNFEGRWSIVVELMNENRVGSVEEGICTWKKEKLNACPYEKKMTQTAVLAPCCLQGVCLIFKCSDAFSRSKLLLGCNLYGKY